MSYNNIIMIIDFSFKNYKSFKDEQHFSMRRDTSVSIGRDSITDKNLPIEGLNMVTAFYGANASGKSNFVDSLHSLQELVKTGKTTRSPFAASENQDSEYGIAFAYSGIKYNYHIVFNNEKIKSERLQIYKSDRPSLVYEKKDNEDTMFFAKNFDGEEKTATSYNAAKNPRKPLLYLLKSSSNRDVKDAYDFFAESLVFKDSTETDISSVNRNLRHAFDNYPERINLLNRIIPAADFGVSKVELVEKEMGMNEKQLKIMYEAVIKMDEAGERKLTESDKKKLTDNITNMVKRASFEHKIDGKLFAFEIDKESNGTIIASNIFIDILDALEKGVTYIVDEIDCSLHPSLIRQIIDVFNDKATNPNDAQLIFTSHDISILDSSIYGESILDRDQVWFAEKNNDGESNIYPLTSIKNETRKEDNVYKKYVEGRYGAIPKISLFYEIQRYWDKSK